MTKTTKLPEHLVMINGQLWFGPLYDTRQFGWVDRPPIRTNYRYQHAEIATVADLKATLRAGRIAWPGGYPLYFVTADGGALSFDSVCEELRAVMAAIRDNDNSGWQVVACTINFENADLTCSFSGQPIESAYGENNPTPNLDGMSVDDVRNFLRDCRIDCLREYATMKIRAMEHRLKGHIQAAIYWEAELEKIYNQLPESLKW